MTKVGFLKERNTEKILKIISQYYVSLYANKSELF